MSESLIQRMAQVLDAVVDTVEAIGPDGTPAGPLYQALATQGCTLNQFEQVMGALVKAGRVRKRGYLYLPIRPA